MAKQGILTVAMIRNIPVAPFTIVNLIAGASHIRLKDYLIGTALGMLPGRLGVVHKNINWEQLGTGIDILIDRVQNGESYGFGGRT